MEKIRDFLDHLGSARTGFTPEEAADALWLATHMTGVSGPPRRPVPRQPVRDLPGVPAPSAAGDGDRATRPDKVRVLHSAQSGPGSEFTGLDALTIRLPDPRDLRDTLGLQRALHPLLRATAAGPAVVLDEESTATHSAEADAVIPFLAPVAERWLSLAIVIDTSPSMALWGNLAAELEVLLTQLGAFRTIGVWDLRFGQDETGVLPRAATGRPRPPRELVDPAGRRAFLVLTDCVGAPWSSGTALEMIGIWARTGPLAIVQPLSQLLWNRAGVDCHRVRLRSPFPGAPNHRLIVEPADDRVALAAQAGPPVPILETDPRWFASWARLIAGTGRADAVAAFCGMTSPGTADQDSDPVRVTRRFRAGASAEAWQLAGYLAAAPTRLSLPLMRLIQQVMFDDPRPQHLAEVYLSGLLRTADASEDSSGRPMYEFPREIQRLLLRTIRTSDAIRVRERVSEEYSRPRHATTAGATGLLAVPPGTTGRPLTDGDEAYSAIDTEVLRRIGGRYADAAAVPEAPDQAAVPDLVTQPPGNPPSEAERLVIEQDVRTLREASKGITMWGPPAAGKTTFLAALNIALVQQNWPWRLSGVDEADAEALTGLTAALDEEATFPQATNTVAHYHWQLTGIVRRKRGRVRPVAVQETVTIPLDLIDVAGGSAHPATAGPVRWRALMDNLERSKGIFFFFDPVTELTSGGAFIHAIEVIRELSERMRDRRLANGRLPHYVAVCLTKFDEIKVLRAALAQGLAEPSGERGCPRVPENEARDFFTHLCEISDNDAARHVPGLLEANFSGDRIRYFVSSAIGFYVDEDTGRYDPDDFQNYIPAYGDEPARIRGTVDPVNVVDPVLWLGQCVAQEEVS